MIAVDTSLVIDELRAARKGKNGPLGKRLEQTPDEELALPVFVLCELELGAARSARPAQEAERVRSFASACRILYPDRRFAQTYGAIAARLTAGGRVSPLMDLLIGVTVLVAGATLITRDRRGFAEIPGLDLELL